MDYKLRAVPAGFFLLTLIILSVSKIYMFPYLNSSFPLLTTTEDPVISLLLDGRREETASEAKNSMCDRSNQRSDFCEMEGDVRVHGKSSTLILVTHSQANTQQRKVPSPSSSSRIKPYARKGDTAALQWVKELTLKSEIDTETAHRCTVNHTTPAIVFSTGGYAGNLFHAFTDVLIPLFLTSVEYQRSVQFLVTDKKPSWIKKHRIVLDRLSEHEIIDLDKDDQFRCFPRATVGLRCHKEFDIDPARSPLGYSMANFTQFVRKAYSLDREVATKIKRQRLLEKPRLLIIARKLTRSIDNIDQIVTMAEEMGYIAIVAEANVSTDASEFARIVNSCDVMVGVHGAGLSNLVFLPTNAILIQIVPWGEFGSIARSSFGWPAFNAKLRYLQYEISLEESSLMGQYPRDNPIVRDPLSVHKQGWGAIRKLFFRQNVRLNLKRFKRVLGKAFMLLYQ